MEASAREIANNVSASVGVAARAQTLARDMNSLVQSLGESSNEIGEVIKLISSIAGQTNLLALNATIEAARAGAAGRGFAVVASEVKELARETASATGSIGQKVEKIQNEVSLVVKSIQQMSEVIDQINSLSSGIAGAVEEQCATTSEMARSISSAAQQAHQITENVSEISNVAEKSHSNAEVTLSDSQKLTSYALTLKKLVEGIVAR
jgi:methyl-accepting chemotaxis protein